MKASCSWSLHNPTKRYNPPPPYVHQRIFIWNTFANKITYSTDLIMLVSLYYHKSLINMDTLRLQYILKIVLCEVNEIHMKIL